MKANKIFLALGIIGFVLIFIGSFILVVGSLKTNEELVIMAFIPVFLGIALIVSAIVYYFIKFLRKRK